MVFLHRGSERRLTSDPTSRVAAKTLQTLESSLPPQPHLEQTSTVPGRLWGWHEAGVSEGEPRELPSHVRIWDCKGPHPDGESEVRELK